MRRRTKAVFLDRDGVINDVVDRGDDCVVAGKKVRWTAPWTYDEFHITEGAHEALENISQLGYLRILVTNQPDIAYGAMTRDAHERIMADVKELPFDDIAVCFHTRYDGCSCKKPKPGMLIAAAEKWNIDLPSSYIIGDTSDDVGTGTAAGCTTILIAGEQSESVAPDYRVSNLGEAVEIIKQQA